MRVNGEDQVVVEKEAIHPWRWRALSIWMLVTTAAIVWYGSTLQSSRVYSCKQTYNGIVKVFHPFFVPESQQTPQQKKDQETFNQTITRLKAGCNNQTLLKLHR
jgi:hypothetical protein